MEYVINYATTRYGALTVETISFDDEQDARVAFDALRKVSHVIDAELCDPQDRLVDEFNRT